VDFATEGINSKGFHGFAQQFAHQELVSYSLIQQVGLRILQMLRIRPINWKFRSCAPSNHWKFT